MALDMEYKINKYNQIKTELLKMSKCIEYCEASEVERYQDICLEFSKELKEMKKHIESTYGIEICNCCVPE